MNFNALIAILILKNVITEDEGQAVVDYLHDKPQSTVLRDTIADVKPLLMPVEALMPQLGPIGPEQRQEEIAARTAGVTAPPVFGDATITDDNGFHHPVDPTPPAEPEQPETKPEIEKPAETDKPAKPTSVKKADDKPAKK